MNLYEINRTLESLFWRMCDVDPETGELLEPDAAEEFEALTELRETKIENALLYIKNLRAEAKAIRDEEKSLAARRKSLERADERMTAFVKDILGGEKFSTAKASVAYRKTTAVEVDPEFINWAMESGADALLRYKEPEVDKTALKEWLKTNESEYARVAQNVSMTIK